MKQCDGSGGADDSVNVNVPDLEYMYITDSELICAEDHVTDADDNLTTAFVMKFLWLCMMTVQLMWIVAM